MWRTELQTVPSFLAVSLLTSYLKNITNCKKYSHSNKNNRDISHLMTYVTAKKLKIIEQEEELELIYAKMDSASSTKF